MRKRGEVTRWNDDRGFGFIRSPDTPADVFFHVRDFDAAGGERPAPGMTVQFEEIHIGGKGPRAVAVRPASMLGFAATPAARSASPSTKARGTGTRSQTRSASAHRSTADASDGGVFIALMSILAYAAAIGWSVWARRLPAFFVPGLAAINVLTFLAYAFDKHAARNGRWRTSEATLNLWALVGGWPAAWFAQRLLRHKTRKQPFRSIYVLASVIHCVGLIAWAWLFGR